MKITATWDSPAIRDFPKLQCPFVRESDQHTVTPEIADMFQWVFEPGVRAVDKLHGTNICIHIEDGVVVAIDNRTTRIVTSPLLCKEYTGIPSKAIEGVVQAAIRGWLKELPTGRHFGELIGPDFNSNLHQLDHHLFVPFEYLREKCHWHSWIQNKYPKDFETISEWFKELPSLFNQRFNKKTILAEGLVFYSEDGKMAKLRRDMFQWYKGKRHKEAPNDPTSKL